MKYLLLLTLILLAVSCEENVPSWDELDAQERQNIRNRSSAKCKTDSEANIKKHLNNAREKMLGMARKQYWKIEFGENVANSSKETSYIYVWKRVGETVYFIHRDKSENISFIKMTADFNEKMLRDMLERNCEEDSADNIVVSTGASAASIFIKDRSFASPPDYYKLDTTFKTESRYPVFFVRYLYEQKKKKLKESGSSTVTETKTYIAKITATDDDFEDLPASYTGYTDPEFCIPDFTADPEAEDVGQIDLNYSQTQGLALNCVDSVAGPVNPVPVEMDMNFVPSNEL